MTLCRVFQRVDGTLAVFYPNEERRRPGESDADLLTRLAARDPSLAGLPFVDADPATLPARSKACAECGVDHPVRQLWRLAAGTVSVAAAENVYHTRDNATRAINAEREKPAPDFMAIAKSELARDKAIAKLRR